MGDMGSKNIDLCTQIETLSKISKFLQHKLKERDAIMFTGDKT